MNMGWVAGLVVFFLVGVRMWMSFITWEKARVHVCLSWVLFGSFDLLSFCLRRTVCDEK
jgi:hypothetical protein